MARKRKKAKASSRSTSKGRASWRGMVRFGLVSFPVEAFNAHALEKDHVALHQLHAKCHSRIRYQKTCPIHGPVDNDEIVSGYEVGKGRYVEIDDEDLDKARTDAEKALTIDSFVSPEQIDPFYLDGRVYFLSPQGASAREPYSVFLEALHLEKRYGVGTVVFSGREQLVLVRPYEEVLLMMLLNYAAEMREPKETVTPPLPIKAADKKVKLAQQLIESWTDEKFDYASYEDKYFEKLQAVIDDKVHDRETVAPEADEEPDVINLTDALRKSLGKSTPRLSSHAHRAPRKARRSASHR